MARRFEPTPFPAWPGPTQRRPVPIYAMSVNLTDPEVEFITGQFYAEPPTKEWSVPPLLVRLLTAVSELTRDSLSCWVRSLGSG